MSATVITKIPIEVPAGDEVWSFDVRIPPMSVIMQLDDLLRDGKEKTLSAATKLFSDSDILGLIKPGISFEDALRNDPEIQQIVIKKHGNSLLQSAMDSTPDSVKFEIAQLIDSNSVCSQPVGLVDDDGIDVTWERLRELNEPAWTDALYKVGTIVYEHTRGVGAKERLKNLNSSSQ